GGEGPPEQTLGADRGERENDIRRHQHPEQSTLVHTTSVPGAGPRISPQDSHLVEPSRARPHGGASSVEAERRRSEPPHGQGVPWDPGGRVWVSTDRAPPGFRSDANDRLAAGGGRDQPAALPG